MEKYSIAFMFIIMVINDLGVIGLYIYIYIYIRNQKFKRDRDEPKKKKKREGCEKKGKR